jgi:hypothetical protein
MQGIAIEIAQLYLVQGHYIRALEACKAFQRMKPNDKTGVGNELAFITLDAQDVCLQLISAYVEISRSCKLQTALNICQQVYDSWLSKTSKCDGAKNWIKLLSNVQHTSTR